MADTTIGSTIIIDGEVSGSDPIVVQGTVKGKINVQADVYVETSATVQADLEAESIEVAGLMTGNLLAHSRVELKAESKLIGDITAPRIHIADGALFKGNIDMQIDGEG